MRTLAIGDIHGCLTALLTLLDAVNLRNDDRLILLGDYVDRGPASKQVIDWIIKNREPLNITALKGNHEIMMRDARNGGWEFDSWLGYGGLETLASYHGMNGGDEDLYQRDWTVNDLAAVPDEHWKFLWNTQPFHETDTHIFVHANAYPTQDMAEQVELALYWTGFEAMRPHQSGKKIICGHTSQKDGVPKDVGFGACIDTSACRGQWLTCLDTASEQYWQANEAGETRDGSLKDLPVQ